MMMSRLLAVCEHACCTLLHQGGCGCERCWSPTRAPMLLGPPLYHSWPSQAGRQAVRKAQLSGGKECAAHLPTPLPVPPVGGVSRCLGCLENFSETPGHPVCFGLCSTHHTPSAHPHHTTPPPPQCSRPACTHVPWHPCTLARMPGAPALGSVWNSRVCVTRPPRL